MDENSLDVKYTLRQHMILMDFKVKLSNQVINNGRKSFVCESSFLSEF